MEIIVGQEPMAIDGCRYAMWSCSATAAPFPFKAMHKISLTRKNVAVNHGRKSRSQFSFTKEDTNNDIESSSIVAWIEGGCSFSGADEAAFVVALEGDEEDD